MRTKAKRDGNEQAIVEALEAAGVCVLRVSSPGAPDLLLHDDACRLVWRCRFNEWLPAEVKTRTGRLTQAQREFLAKAEYPILRTVDDGLALIGVRA